MSKPLTGGVYLRVVAIFHPTCSLIISWWLSTTSSSLSHLALSDDKESKPLPATARSRRFFSSANAKWGRICTATHTTLWSKGPSSEGALRVRAERDSLQICATRCGCTWRWRRRSPPCSRDEPTACPLTRPQKCLLPECDLHVEGTEGTQ